MKAHPGWFAFRAAVWAVSPSAFVFLPERWDAGALAGGLVAAAGLQWMGGGTLWFGLNRIQLGVQAGGAILAGILWGLQGAFRWDVEVLFFLFIVALGSDIVASPRAAKLLWAMAVPVAGGSITLAILRPGHEYLYLFWMTGFLAGFSSLARPRDGYGVMLTSLDYWFGRVELLSWGMTKLLATGWRRG